MNRKPNIILIGMKSSGKTTIGRWVARKLGLRFTDVDAEVERLHFTQKGERLRFREIFQNYGKDYFRTLETAALQTLAAARSEAPFVLATGGGLPLAEENRILLRRMGTIVFLDVAQDVLLPRITARGIPAFFPYPNDPAKSLAELLAVRRPIYGALAQITVACRFESQQAIADTIINQLETHPCED
jgi:shikimate kinase